MVIVMKADAPRQEIEKIKDRLETEERKISVIEGTNYRVIGIIGDTTNIDTNEIEANEHVEKVMRVQQSYKPVL